MSDHDCHVIIDDCGLVHDGKYISVALHSVLTVIKKQSLVLVLLKGYSGLLQINELAEFLNGAWQGTKYMLKQYRLIVCPGSFAQPFTKWIVFKGTTARGSRSASLQRHRYKSLFVISTGGEPHQ